MIFDPFYLLICLGTTALAMLASWRVKSAYNHYSQVPASSGMSGLMRGHTQRGHGSAVVVFLAEHETLVRRVVVVAQ